MLLKENMHSDTKSLKIFSKLNTGPYRKINKESLVSLIGGDKIINLLFHIPNYFLSRELIENIEKEHVGTHVALKIIPFKYVKSFKRGLPHRVKCKIGGFNIDLVFFNFDFKLLNKMLPPNEERIISGKLGYYRGIYQVTNPDYMIRQSEYYKIKNEPIYPLTAGITNQSINKVVHHNIKNLFEITEWHDEEFKRKSEFVGFIEALTKMHLPENDNEIDNRGFYLKRLAYDELLASQLAVQLMRKNNKEKMGNTLILQDNSYDKFIKSLPFNLTKCQEKLLLL